MKFWQVGVRVQVHDLFHHLAHALAAVGGVDHAADDRQAAHLALDLGVADQLVAEFALAFLELDGLGPQHHVRKIQVPFMRWHVGALGLVAEVAHEALVNDLPVIFLGNPVDFKRI